VIVRRAAPGTWSFDTGADAAVRKLGFEPKSGRYERKLG